MNGNMFRMAVLFASCLGHAGCSAEDGTNNPSARTAERASNQAEQAMQIRIRAGEQILTARLEDSAAARDFAAMLPLSVTLKDYASTEKVADLPRKLSIDGAPDGVDPDLGDLAYYAPWGNLAIFHRDFDYSRGLVRLGRIESGIERLGSLSGPVTFEVIE